MIHIHIAVQLSVGLFETNFSEILSQIIMIFIQEIISEIRSAQALMYQFIVAYWHHIRQQRIGSILAQVMAYCLTAPSHYLNQYWPINDDVL